MPHGNGSLLPQGAVTEPMATPTQEATMFQGIQKKSSQQKVPGSPLPGNTRIRANHGQQASQRPRRRHHRRKLRIAVCAGTLTYLTAGKSDASLAEAVLIGAAAFAGAIRLLDSIIS